MCRMVRIVPQTLILEGGNGTGNFSMNSQRGVKKSLWTHKGE